MQEDWNKTAEDYARHRAGFPAAFFDKLRHGYGIDPRGKRILDLGTGTGLLARAFALMGARVTGIDIAGAMIDAAKRSDAQEGVAIEYRQAPAEETGFPDRSFDIVCAATCWHWFDGKRAASEMHRLLVPGGIALICMLSWLPLPGSLVEKTEALIVNHNPIWKMGGRSGLMPEYLADLRFAGFSEPESFSFDHDLVYSPADWRGRIRASAGVAASLPPDKVTEFDRDLADLLVKDYPTDKLFVPHRIFAALARKKTGCACG